jgi:predicted nucleotidyltransferase component of viral defense system
MSDTDLSFPHNEDRQEFKEALAYTESRTGFSSILIEKDYYCSLLLRYLYHAQKDESRELVFKGGTCLSKVYVDFYRLSEDLDFVIPVDPTTGRQTRRKKIQPLKTLFEQIPQYLPGVSVEEQIRGHNESKQYIGYVQYPSVVYKREEHIKVEIGLREPLIENAQLKKAKSIIRNPFTRSEYLSPFTVQAITLREAYAEKMRAALSRREPAIRDFFDLYYAYATLDFDFSAEDFLHMVRQKLSVPGNDPIDVSPARKRQLVQQAKTHLQSVLRLSDYSSFNIERSFRIVSEASEHLESPP